VSHILLMRGQILNQLLYTDIVDVYACNIFNLIHQYSSNNVLNYLKYFR